MTQVLIVCFSGIFTMSSGKRYREKELTLEQRGEIIGMKKLGLSNRQVAEKCDVDQSTAGRNWLKHLKFGTTKNLPRSGRPRKSNSQQDKYIRISSLRDRNLPSRLLANNLFDKEGRRVLHARSVRRRLVEAGLDGRRPRKKPLLNRTQKTKRLKWARKYRNWTVDQWRNVLWSDESPFHLFSDAGRLYVRRRPWEEYLDICLKPTVKFGGGHINVWGCMSSRGVGNLYRIEGIMDSKKYHSILVNHMSPLLKQMDSKVFWFQHDNDPKHTAKKVKNYLSNQQFNVLEWPSQSPDLNPIENMWGYIKAKIRDRTDRASSLHDVFRIVKEEWQAIPLNYINTLIESMPSRIKKVIKSHGGATCY
jgi:transposase